MWASVWWGGSAARPDRQLAGIETRRSPAPLDELPDAYKDIDTVMLWADELVEIVHEFRQLINVKDV